MALKPKQDREDFVSVLSSDATLRKVVPEGTVGAVTREYEDSKGNKGTKIEMIYESMNGIIKNIKFVDTDFGRLIQVTLLDFPTDEVLSLSTSSPFGKDFMKKLPNIDLSKDVSIRPYSFIPEGKAKKSTGLSITQCHEKVRNAFYDPETKQTLKGFPVPEGDTKKYTNDDWKIHFLQVRKFLVKYTEEHFITKVENNVTESVDESMDDFINKMNQKMGVLEYLVEEDCTPENIPF